MLKYPVSLKRETFPRGRMEIIELKIEANSKLKDISLTALYSVVKCRILVCSVIRGGELIAPAGDFVLREGDCIYVTAPTDDMAILLKNLGIITHKIKNVMICGGGRVSYYLASRLLRTGIQVHIIETNRERCEDLSKNLPRADIIHGDATDRDLLDTEGLAKCDALVTMTGMDEINMVVSMYGYKCGVDQVITKLSHEGNSNLLDTLSLGGIICPKELCSNTIVQYVHALDNQTGTAQAVHTFAGGRAKAMEFIVDEQTRYCGIPLKDLKIRKNILVVGIKHGLRTEVPNGESMYEKGDILVIVSGEKEIVRLNDIFE
jgi:trk system potassium uptake protein TrkA